jgi:hypothetical protein
MNFLENIDTSNLRPGSINLKPIGSLSIDDFRNDFEINVIDGKSDPEIFTRSKKGTNPSIYYLAL